MSKFFAEGNISDEDENSGPEENDNNNRKQPSYQYDFLDDRLNNDKRVVRTEKEKKWNLIKDITNKINGALNNQDFEKVWVLLQELLKQIEKAAKLIEKEGYPSYFLRCLHRVQDQITEFNKNTEVRKKMKKHSSIAFNILSQKMKKIYKEYEEKINELLEKGQEEEEEEIEQIESESSSDSDQDDITLLDSDDPMIRRRYWLKKVVKKEETKKQQQDAEEKKKEERRKEEKVLIKKEFKILPEKKKMVEIQSIKDAENRMREIRQNFMKLHNQEERQEYMVTLDKIYQSTIEGKDFQKLSFYLLDLPIRIDVCRQMKLTHFPRTQWLKLYHTIKKIHKLLRESEEDSLVENVRLFEDTNSKSESTIKVTEEGIYISLKTYLILIENEIKKALVFVASNQSEYYERLQDLIGLVDLMYRISKELQIKDGYEKEAAELAFKVLQNSYFIDADLIFRIKKKLEVEVEFLQLVDEETIREYANLILRYQTDQQTKTKTLLYLIYNHAVNGREKGKELLIISTLSQTISHHDYYTQVLYNRVMVQVGLMAFRQGNMFEVQQFLYEMCSMTKAKQNTRDVLKEFLAQGFSRLYNEKDIPKNKVLPVYLHLNTEIVQCLQLIASMLLETPYTLTEGGRITSKTFKRFIYEYERNFAVKENHNNRDLIYSASQSLKEGNWQDCYNHLDRLTIWTVLPDVQTTKQNLQKAIKEQSLKCYLIGNRKCFKSIALKGLAQKYSLDAKTTRKHICKLISEKIIQGSITRAGYLIFVQKKQTDMQKVCETFFEKVKEVKSTHEQWLSQKFNAGYDSDQEKEENVVSRRSNLALNQKLKAFLSKRKQKF